jgi:tetratricopeptide (TPR) repeat protein
MSRRKRNLSPYDDLITVAKERIAHWRAQHSIVWQDIATNGLSKAHIGRILTPDAKRPLNIWLTKVVALFNRINVVCATKHRVSNRSWEEIFGDEFPKPPIIPDSAVSNYADVAVDKVRALATPLIEFLNAEFRLANDQHNIWKASQFLIRVCALYELTSDWQRAADSFGRLAELNRQTGDFHHVADALLRRGLALFYAGSAKEAETQFQAGLDVIAEHSSKVPPYRTELRLLNYLALAKSELGESEEARRLLEAIS